jgi:hypothetical protein
MIRYIEALAKLLADTDEETLELTLIRLDHMQPDGLEKIMKAVSKAGLIMRVRRASLDGVLEDGHELAEKVRLHETKLDQKILLKTLDHQMASLKDARSLKDSAQAAQLLQIQKQQPQSPRDVIQDMPSNS